MHHKGMDIEGVFLFEASVNLFSAFVSILIAYYSYKASKMGADFLGYTSSGFTLLSVSLLTRSVYMLSVTGGRPIVFALTREGFIVNNAVMVLAYLLIAYSYFKSHREMSGLLLAIPPINILFNPSIEMVLFMISLYITLTLLVSYLDMRSSSTLYVTFAFLLVSISHLSFLMVLLSESGLPYFLGSLARLVGFLILLWVIIKVAGRSK